MKKKGLIMAMFFISSFFLVGMEKKVDAAVSVLQNSPNVTFVNNDGVFLSGPKLDLENVVPINYVGTNIKEDVWIYKTDGSLKYPQGWAGVTLNSTNKGEVVRVRNTSFYKGKPTVLAISDPRGGFEMTNPKGNMLQITSRLPDPTRPTFQIWIEDEDGNKILDPNIKFMTAQTAELNDPGLTIQPPNSYATVEWNNPDYGLKNVVMDSTTNLSSLKNLQVDFLSTSDFKGLKIITNTRDSYPISYNTIFQQGTNPVVVTASTYFGGSYPNGQSIQQGFLAKRVLSFFDDATQFLVPYPNPQVSIETTENTAEYTGKLDMNQAVYAQSRSTFYKDLQIDLTVPEGVSVDKFNESLVIMDKDGNNITNQVTTETTENLIKISISKELLETIGNNNLSIVGTLKLDKTASKMKQYDKTGTGTFSIPLTATNSDNPKSTATGNMKVKIPAPTGTAVMGKVVNLGTKVSEYNPVDFVENLNSFFTDDSVEVVGFNSTTQTFSKIGEDSVTVIIKSKETGVTNSVEVPVNVIEAPQDQVEVAFDEQGTEKEKEIAVDKSNIKNIQDKIYWKTNLPNQRYKLAVRDPAGTLLFTYSDLITNGNDVNTFLERSITVPVSLWELDYGDNKFSFEFYRIDTQGDMTGEAVAKLEYNIVLSGSLQLVSVPNNLNWTNRTVNDSKGLLTRDSGQSMTIEVIDTRNLKEENKNWSLNAQMKNEDGSIIPFTFQWKDTVADEGKSLETSQTVLTKNGATKDGDTYSKSWNEETGVLLYSPNELKVGDYSKKVSILWQLSDTKKIE